MSSVKYENILSLEYTQEELEQFEKELMGFSLSEKPIDEILLSIAHLSTHKIADIFETDSKNEQIKLAVILTDIRVIVTKTSGKEMAFIKAKDETGSIDLILFPRNYESLKNVLYDDKSFLVTGKINNKDDSVSLIVDNIVPSKKSSLIDAGDFVITIPKEASSEDLRLIKNVLIENPGHHNVSLIFEGNSNRKINLPIKVLWSKELSEKIKNIFSKKELLD